MTHPETTTTTTRRHLLRTLGISLTGATALSGTATASASTDTPAIRTASTLTENGRLFIRLENTTTRTYVLVTTRIAWTTATGANGGDARENTYFVRPHETRTISTKLPADAVDWSITYNPSLGF